MASAAFSAGKPGEESIELARLVERCFRGSGALDLEALCVLPGRKVGRGSRSQAALVMLLLSAFCYCLYYMA
jgi:hypothetical protein